MLIGITVGAIAGYLGGVVDETLMRITDIFFSVPSLILAIAFVYVLGYSLNNLLAARPDAFDVPARGNDSSGTA